MFVISPIIFMSIIQIWQCYFGIFIVIPKLIPLSIVLAKPRTPFFHQQFSNNIVFYWNFNKFQVAALGSLLRSIGYKCSTATNNIENYKIVELFESWKRWIIPGLEVQAQLNCIVLDLGLLFAWHLHYKSHWQFGITKHIKTAIISQSM